MRQKPPTSDKRQGLDDDSQKINSSTNPIETTSSCDGHKVLEKNYSIDAEIAMRDVIAGNGLVPPAHINPDGNVHRFDGKHLHGRRRDCWYAADTHPVPILVGGAPGIEFEYEHTSLLIAYTERLLINSKFRELKSKTRRIDQPVKREVLAC